MRQKYCNGCAVDAQPIARGNVTAHVALPETVPSRNRHAAQPLQDMPASWKGHKNKRQALKASRQEAAGLLCT